MLIGITGGNGFIGSNLVDKLIELGHEVVAFDNYATGKRENLNSKSKFIYHNIATYSHKVLTMLLRDCEVVYHMAALPRVEPSIHDPVKYNEANVNGTLNVFTACRDAGIKKIIFSSSSSVYGNSKNLPTKETEAFDPMSPYALQKQIGEEYAKLFCKLYDMTIPCLRYFNVIGNRSPQEGAYVPVVGIWFRQMLEKNPLTITGDGNNSRDFINVLDVVDANLLFLDDKMCPKGYNAYNVGSGKSYKLIDVANMCSDNIVHIEPRVEPKATLADISKLKKLGWSPKIDLETWIKENKPRIS